MAARVGLGAASKHKHKNIDHNKGHNLHAKEPMPAKAESTMMFQVEARDDDGERIRKVQHVAASKEVHDRSWAVLKLQRFVKLRFLNLHRFS